MKRFIFICIIFLSICTMLPAVTAVTTGVGFEGPFPTLDVNFYYDPATMQRYTFGFTDRTDLSWFDASDDYGDAVLNLRTRYVRDNITYGYGLINFYWKLKANDPVDAELFLQGPLKDPNTEVELDWSLAFNSEKDNGMKGSEITVAKYGQENAEVIYSMTPGMGKEGLMGYIPVEIITAESNPSVGNQNYEGTIGILVKKL